MCGCARSSSYGGAASRIARDVELKEAALRHMFAGAGGDSEVAAFVIQDERDGDVLVGKFAGHSPPVSNTVEVDTESGLALDRATGRRVTLWSAEVEDVKGDGAVVRVSLYSGSLAAAGFTLGLRRGANAWVVVSERMEYVS